VSLGICQIACRYYAKIHSRSTYGLSEEYKGPFRVKAYSRMMFRYSLVFTKPLYFTILGCYEEEVKPISCLLSAVQIYTHVQIFEEINLGLNWIRHPPTSQKGIAKYEVHRRTIISPKSPLGMFASEICLTATVSPVVQFNAPAHLETPRDVVHCRI
jgi:hypothetical protein